MNIYFLGGSFDPPHLGHLEIIKTCFNRFDVGQFILIPTNQSPLKEHVPMATAFHRIEMLKLLIEDFDQKIMIDDWEIAAAAPSYTYDTIKYLKNHYPKDYFFMILGEDQFGYLKEWQHYKKILEIVTVVVFSRSVFSIDSISDIKAIRITDFQIDISSTSIRKKILNGESLKNYLSPNISNYIQKNKLYNLDEH